MSTLSSLSKLSQITLPSGTSYALKDVDGRAMIASDYATGVAYQAGDYVVYQDDLYKITADITSTANTAWSQVTKSASTVGGELKALKNSMVNGIHYRGYTTTALTDGATTNPITIGGSSYTAVAGDLVIYNLTSYRQVAVTSSTFKTDGTFAGSADGYLYTKSGSTYTKVTSGSYSSSTTYYGQVVEGVEFLFNGSSWDEFGSAGALKAMAFADTASGSASVSVSGTASAQTFTGTEATISISGNVSGTAVTITPTDDNKETITPFASGGSFTQGEDTFSAGTAPSFTQGEDSFSAGAFPTLSAGTTPVTFSVASETLTIASGTAPSLSSGTLPSFTQGTDSFSAGTAPSFTQGTDSFTAAAGGTAVTVLKSLPSPSVTQGTFSGSTTYTPQGSNASSSVSATGTATVTVTPDVV